jgi:hypothetical protein
MRKIQNNSPNHVPPWINFLEEKGNKFLGRRGLSCHEEQLSPRSNFFWGKGIKLPWGASSQMFEKKSARNKLCPNQMFFTPLESSKILDIKNDHAFFI